MPCRDCFRGTIHDHAEPKGVLEQLYGYKTYVANPPGGTESKSTIIFYTDAFGLHLPNNKILADHYAAETGFRVLVPDIIPGGGVSEDCMHAMNDVFRPIPSWWSLLNPVMYATKAWGFVRFVPIFVPFLITAASPKAYPECLRYAREVRAGLGEGGKLGVAGYCWGGYPSTKLCGEYATETDKSTPLVDASFTAHPSSLDSPKDVVESLKLKVPYFCAVAEYDFLFDKGAAEAAEAAVKTELGDGKTGPYEFYIHKGAHHGFSVRASPDEGSVGKESYEVAAKQAIGWFKKYLS